MTHCDLWVWLFFAVIPSLEWHSSSLDSYGNGTCNMQVKHHNSTWFWVLTSEVAGWEWQPPLLAGSQAHTCPVQLQVQCWDRCLLTPLSWMYLDILLPYGAPANMGCWELTHLGWRKDDVTLNHKSNLFQCYRVGESSFWQEGKQWAVSKYTFIYLKAKLWLSLCNVINFWLWHYLNWRSLNLFLKTKAMGKMSKIHCFTLENKVFFEIASGKTINWCSAIRKFLAPNSHWFQWHVWFLWELDPCIFLWGASLSFLSPGPLIGHKTLRTILTSEFCFGFTDAAPQKGLYFCNC